MGGRGPGMGLLLPGYEGEIDMDYAAFFEYINEIAVFCAFGLVAGIMVCAYSWLIIEGVKDLIRMLKLCFGRREKEDTKHE